MKLCELMSVGDDNVVGRMIDDAKLALSKCPKTDAVRGLLVVLNNITNNPHIVTDDGYSLTTYLQLLTKPTLDNETINMVYDALGSFEDSGSE
ncbi:MAG: hypothetical protein CTY12_00230 [Methylotenera sp.]|nr:MAG: hypothetical protein CTY12_00230 [Methylotenera sp.]